MTDNPPTPQSWAHLDELPLQIINRFQNARGALLTVVVSRTGTTPALIAEGWSQSTIARGLRALYVPAPDDDMEAIAHWISSAPVEVTDIG